MPRVTMDCIALWAWLANEKKPFGNAPETSPFAILRDFMLADDQNCGGIWALDINIRLVWVCSESVLRVLWQG